MGTRFHAFFLYAFLSWAIVLSATVNVQAVGSAATESVDTVYLNATVLTMNATSDIVQAVAVEGEKIKAVGSSNDIRTLVGPKTRVVDLTGKTLLPGFIDAHGHFPESGIRALYRVDCNSPPVGTTKSIADLIQRLKEKAQKTPKGEWVQGFGYDDTLLEDKRHPTRDDLNRTTRDSYTA